MRTSQIFKQSVLALRTDAYDRITQINLLKIRLL